MNSDFFWHSIKSICIVLIKDAFYAIKIKGRDFISSPKRTPVEKIMLMLYVLKAFSES